MKYYDNNGRLHDDIFKAYWSDIIAGIKPKKEIPPITTKVAYADIRLEGGQRIEVDYESNRIYLKDSLGNIVTESEIDSRLKAGVLDNILVDINDPNLTESQFIEKILEDPKIIEGIKNSKISVTIDDKGTFTDFFTSVLTLSSKVIDSAIQNSPAMVKKGGSNIIQNLLAATFKGTDPFYKK